METVVLVIHLLLALTLIGVVLMQRSEGGGLGMGGGGGGTMSGRSASTALGKVTWVLAIAFICTSLALTVLAARSSGSGSVLDRITGTGSSDGVEIPADGDSGSGLLPPVPTGDSLLPPGGSTAPAGDDLNPGGTGGLTPDAN